MSIIFELSRPFIKPYIKIRDGVLAICFGVGMIVFTVGSFGDRFLVKKSDKHGWMIEQAGELLTCCKLALTYLDDGVIETRDEDYRQYLANRLEKVTKGIPHKEQTDKFDGIF